MSNTNELPTPPQCGACHTASRVVADHHEQGWVLLADGTIVFDDSGEILTDGSIVEPHRPEVEHRLAVAS